MSRCAWLATLCVALWGCEGQRQVPEHAAAPDVPASRLSDADTPRSPFELTPGVVVDPQLPAAYLMQPEGGIEAVDLSSGKVLWTTDRAARPLGVHTGTLYGQVEGGSDLILLGLRQKNGREIRRLEIPLPEGVSALVSRRDGQSFRARVYFDDAQLLVAWDFSAWVPVGMDPGGSTTFSRQVSGGAKVDLGSGEVEVLDKGNVHQPREKPLPPAVAALVKSGELPGPIWRTGSVVASPVRGPEGSLVIRRFDAGSGEPLSGSSTIEPGTILRLPSADQRHVLSSRLVEGERSTWRWLLFSLETGEQVAEVRGPLPSASFCAVGSTLAYVLQEDPQAAGKTKSTSRVRLQAVDLKTGDNLWSRPVRDVSAPLSAPPAGSGG